VRMRGQRSRREPRVWSIAGAARASREIASKLEGAGKKEEEAQELGDFPGAQNDKHLRT
jgi:hypothetical protein